MALPYDVIRPLTCNVSAGFNFLVKVSKILNVDAGWAKEESARGIVSWFDRFTV